MWVVAATFPAAGLARRKKSAAIKFLYRQEECYMFISMDRRFSKKRNLAIVLPARYSFFSVTYIHSFAKNNSEQILGAMPAAGA